LANHDYSKLIEIARTAPGSGEGGASAEVLKLGLKDARIIKSLGNIVF